MPRPQPTIVVALPEVRSVAILLVLVLASLVVVNLAVQYAVDRLGRAELSGVARVFSLNRENNVPNWWSTALFLVAAFLLAVIARAPSLDPPLARRWAGLSAIFVLLSLDEAASLHERMTRPLRGLLGAGGLLYFTWVIPGVLFTAVVGLACLRLLWSVPATTRWLLVGSGVIFCCGALGFEMLGARHYQVHGSHTLTHLLMTTAEEGLEMAGLSLFIVVLLAYIRRHLATPAS